MSGRTSLRSAFVAVAILSMLTVAGARVSGSKHGGQARHRHRNAITVTGCLQKGDEAGEFSITGEDGKTYGLRSRRVKLADHLGHKVKVTGVLTKEEENEKNEKNENESQEKKEAGDLRVTNLQMISNTCP